MKHFIRFAVLSGGGWLLDCLLLLLLVQMGSGLGPSNFASSMVAGLTVFLLSRGLVFESPESPVLGGTLFYMIYQIFCILVVSMLIGPVAVSGREALEAFGIFPNVAWTSFLGKVLLTPPQLAANFLLSRYLVEYWRRSSTHV